MSMQQTQQHFPLGAHLIVKHFGYSHHGIYAGRGRRRRRPWWGEPG